MFKKPLKVSTHNLLGGKDKKSLKKELCTSFHAKSIEHFFDVNEKIYCDKMQGSKVVVYSTDTYPAFVDSTGKGAYFPTLYLAHAYPKMLEPVFINPGVSKFIFNGANLMWPGVENPQNLSEFKADDVRVIISEGTKPIAIGAMGCDYAELKTKNLEGVAVYVLHIIDDKLWELGPKTGLEVVFTGEEKKVEEKKVEEKKPEENKVEAEDEDEEEEDEDDLANLAMMVKKGKKNEETLEDAPAKQVGKKKQQPEPEVKQAAPKKAEKEAAAPKKAEVFSDEEDDKKKKGKKKGGKAPQKGKEKEEETKEGKKDTKNKEKEVKGKEKDNKKGKKPKKDEDDEEEPEEEEEKKEEEGEDEGDKDTKGGEPTIPIKIMDEYIYEAFMNAIRMSITEKDLPMDASVFYASHMLLCKKENIMIDLKNSSYKKIGKFFQAMAKLNLVEYKEAKKGTSPQITKINRTHEKYEKWEPSIGKIGSKKVEEEKKTSDNDKWPKVTIEELFKPKESMKQLFADDKEKKADNLYTHDEVKNVLNEYIKKNCKVEKKFIKMDPYLCNLFASKIEAEVEAPPVEVKDIEKHDEEEGGEGGDAEHKKVKKVRQAKASSDQILKDELFQRFEDDLIKWHRVTNLETKKSEIKQGNFKGISITAEKAHNKNITKMVGLEQFGIDLNELSSKFQLKFACSVSTHELPGKNAGKELVVHGNFLQDIVDFFTNECKVDRKFITSLNKLEKKKK